MMVSAPRVTLDYLGCKVNQAEIEELGQRFRQAGYAIASAEDVTDVYVLNSCTVTHVADRKTRLLIHQMARRNPSALIVVTGCYPTVDPAAVQAIAGVDVVVANADKPRLVEIVSAQIAHAPRRDRGAADRWPDRRPALGRTRAMLKVQDGCDNFCTYCIVPAARGCVSSVPIPTVIDDIRRRVDEGFQEIVLTGVALGSYGRDWGQDNALTRLVESILRQTALPRLRLSSIEPENLDHALLGMWSDQRFCRHLHLPLQSGCDATLRRMGRRYRSADYAALIERARSIAPDAAITTDIITGFPGETSEEFALSYAFARDMAFARLHVFRFSARRGTAATHLPGRVAETDKKTRSAALLALSDECELAFRRQFLGSTLQVLWEEPWTAPDAPTADGRAWWTGLTGNYIRVYAPSDTSIHNSISNVLLRGETADGMLGQIA